ncbi:MAG: hypothetical protein HQL95_00725 [Magnetococcales bacterium]|nr:hypothetical protein [Magnetococcales bacterium]
MALITCNHGQTGRDVLLADRCPSFIHADAAKPMRFHVVPSVWKYADPTGKEEVSMIRGSSSPEKTPTLPSSDKLLTRNAELKSGVAIEIPLKKAGGL